MTECARQRANDFETKLLPQTNRGFVCRNNEIKLHRAKSEPSRFAQTMFGHGATNSLATRIRGDHEARVGNVRAAARLVRPQYVRARNAACALCDVCSRIRSKPVSQCPFA